MQIISRIARFIKRQVKMYLTFRKLTRAQIDALHRQATLVEDAKRKHSPKPPPHFELTTPGPYGLAVLQEMTQ